MKQSKSRISVLLCLLIVLSLTYTMEPASFATHDPVLPYTSSKSYTEFSPEYWPTDGWRNSTPEAEGMDSGILQDMMNHIRIQDYPIDSVLVIKNGYVVLEEYPGSYYDAERRHEMHSVTKSFASTFIGIAIQQGLIQGVDEKVVEFFPEYTIQNLDSRKEQITIEHLLTMSAGFEWDESTLPYTDPDINDIGRIIVSDDAVQFVLDKPMLYEPREHWLYSAGSSLLLGAIVQQVAGVTTRSFAETYLFDPLGIDGASWFQLPGGWYNTFGGQFRILPRDMAKLGFLYLKNGVWNDTQILSADYVHNATQAHFTDLPYPPDYAGYGWQWWLLPDNETFAALGRAGQKIIVSREHNLIVVFTASIPDDRHDPEFDLFHDYILYPLDPAGNEPLTDPVIIGIVLFAAGGSLAIIAFWQFKKRNAA